MNFASDNWSGASERVIAALSEAARRGGPAYGGDTLTKAVEARFAELFERDVAVFFVASGTFANSLSLSAYARPGGIVFCHREAHINVDEAGATEFFGGGLKLHLIDGVAGKLTPDAFAAGLARFPEGNVHHGQPVAVSLTQITEIGTSYTSAEIAALSVVAKTRGAAVHMDGARFANVIAAGNVSPADMTWRAGVDVLSFGGTKNGCIAAEAVIFFDRAHARDVGFQRQRAGQGFSKNWFIAAQFDAYLKDGHWLGLARHSNAAAAQLARAITQSGKGRLAFDPAGNELFAILPKLVAARLKDAGGVFHPWATTTLKPETEPGADETMIRLVTSWQTSADDVARFAAALAAA